MFFWLGNYTSALCFTNADCAGGICNTTNGQCINTSTPTNTSTIWTVSAWGFCTDPLSCKAWLTCLANKCITDPNAWNNSSSLQSCIASDPLSCPSWKACVGGKCVTQSFTDCSKCTKLPLADYTKWCDSATQDQKTCNNDIYCCSKSEWTACNPPVWWILNSLSACVCPTGTKNVDGTCKPCSDKWVCCGISLNTSVPFIGKCIESENTAAYVGSDETWVTWEKAFPVLMWSLTKMLVTVILIVSFVLILIGGIMITTGNPSGGKKMIIKVVIGIALLWASGVILRLINPNFFG